MLVYKELSILGEKKDFDEFRILAPTLACGDWKYSKNINLRNYIAFDYMGKQAEQAEVTIYYGPETWRDHEIKVGNIVPLNKSQLTISEYNAILDLFYQDIILPYCNSHPTLKIVGPTSEVFNPLEHISETALDKLKLFCNGANKSTGSSYSSDQERWFDFICQTVDDKRVFDYDTLNRFLQDEDYWGKKDEKFVGPMGHFAWDKEHARELANEYTNYVGILQFYNERKWQKEYEDAQR